ncbi:MAG: peptidoglycan DD-metalloendopeptidase family protein [Butyrivibrio sp.]|nr:peptidoglycan DD-metalloendopeptidase family protein [Butyrivibrio sp.]
MKRKLKTAIAVAAIVCLSAAGFGTPDIGATDQSDINKAENEIEDAKHKIEELNNQKDRLRGDIQSVQAYVNELDAALSAITSSLIDYQNQITAKQSQIDEKIKQIADKEAEISDAETDLANAQKSESEQYEAMKLRIQYMYECGEGSFLDMIFSASDLSDLLGKTEYVTSIMEYDRKKLEELEWVRNEISEMIVRLNDDKSELETEKKQLEQEKADLLVLQNDLQVQQNLVNQAIDSKQAAIAQLESDEAYAEQRIKEEKAKLKAAEEEAARLKALWEEEQRRLAAAGSNADEENRKKLEEIGLAGGFTWPLPGYNTITSNFGPRPSPIPGMNLTSHSGTDISGVGVYGKPVVAAYDGVVTVVDVYTASDTRYTKPYGNRIQIDHGAGVVTLYAHLSSMAVSVGQQVKAGDVIGYVGSTGASSGAHLHLTLYLKGILVNPLEYFTIPTY